MERNLYLSKTATKITRCSGYYSSLAMLALLPTLQFSSLFAPTNVSKCEVGNQNYISKLHILLDKVIFNDTPESKLAMLAFLYCGEFVKNSNLYCTS